jgi:hypothetical protein
VLPYDPTQIISEVDPDAEAEVRGHERDIPVETLSRTITWVEPAGDTKLMKKLSIPRKARPQDLMFRFALVTKRQELDARYAIKIIMIHLLGLAPAGYLAAPDNSATRRHMGECSQAPKTV